MTVAEIIAALSKFDQQSNVYVPDSRDNTAQIAVTVTGLEHTNLPDGITIPPDVTITPWTDDEFYEMHGGTNDLA